MALSSAACKDLRLQHPFIRLGLAAWNATRILLLTATIAFLFQKCSIQLLGANYQFMRRRANAKWLRCNVILGQKFFALVLMQVKMSQLVKHAVIDQKHDMMANAAKERNKPAVERRRVGHIGTPSFF